jgi:hypothetical protein
VGELTRSDPSGTIRAVAASGNDFYLNEIVCADDPAVRYEPPVISNSCPRDDIWRLNGFNESMVLGWHLDSNIARRSFLRHGKVDDLIEDCSVITATTQGR